MNFALVVGRIAVLLLTLSATALAQQPPYDVFPPADPPYYRVRYEASTQPGELIFPVNFTVWIPQDVKSLRGVIVHQHGCGEGSCKSGLTGAYDLHWQALAKQHACALLAPAYEQPEQADCQMWCDPRNGSAAAFRRCLVELGAKSGHPELAQVPWALWGHSGGGHWAGGMVLLYPDRVAAAWLRSGVPLLKPDPARDGIKAHTLPDAALKVPVMCNPGTKEGVTIKDGRFSGVWPANAAFFNAVRSKGGLIGVAVDPLTSHECGNQRYLAIPWLDACLSARLPKVGSDPLRDMPTDGAWLAEPTGSAAVPAAQYAGEPLKAAWLPNEPLARAWMQYVKDTAVSDTTPPPAPTNLRVSGHELSWEAEADLESGLAGFLIERDGQFLAKVPEQNKNPFGRPVFQNLQYSDTPTQPLVPMRFTDTQAEPGAKHAYRVMAVNTVGLQSPATALAGPGNVLPAPAGERMRPGEMAGYLIVPNEKVPETFNAGFSMYVAAWPLLKAYPGDRFQSGLFGTWMFAQSAGRAPANLYSDIEGGLGWWRDTRFATETPKFIMGGVAANFVEWANGPGAGKGRDWQEPAGKYAVAQLTPWLLWPPDGVNLKQGTCGELFGYGYLPLPLIGAKATTAGKDVPTGGNCWTLFLNTRNFKGPVTFFTPYCIASPTSRPCSTPT